MNPLFSRFSSNLSLLYRIHRDVIYGSDIHRSCIMYDFNVVDLTGAGLVLGEYERDIFV